MAFSKVVEVAFIIAAIADIGTMGFCTNHPFSRFGGRGESKSLDVSVFRREHQGRNPSRLFDNAFFGDGAAENDNFFDESNLDELKKRIAQVTNPYNGLFGQNEEGGPEDVYIVLFNPGSAEEGVHTIEYPKGSGNNVILAFESMKECELFAGMLKQQQFYDPAPQEIKMSNLESYCESLGVYVQVVPSGMDIKPPSKSVDELGHDPFLKQNKAKLNAIFSLEEAEFNEDGAVDVEELVGSWE